MHISELTFDNLTDEIIDRVDTIWTTDDYEADLRKVRSLYRKEMAKYPDQFIEVE